MQIVFELLFELIFEVVCYGIGRAFLLVLAPHYGVESGKTSPERPWKWRGWSFERDGKRYFYIETVQLVGFAVLLVLAVLVGVANYLRD